jgi:hypothetical protein
MDISEPEVTRELWRSGEVKEKRAQMRQLIRDLSAEYNNEKQKKDEEKGKEEKEKAEKEGKTGDETLPKLTDTPTQTTETKQPDPPAKRRKQLNPIRLTASDSRKVIEVD